MKRYDIINHCIRKYGYIRYLEIGTQAEVCISNVKAPFKVGLDPYPVVHKEENMDVFYQMTSDTYFVNFRDSFDIIFVDGLHHADQVIKDTNNSLEVLNDNGTIVVHDCNPMSEESQVIPEKHMTSWHGDVWKAWIHFRNRDDLKMFVVDLGTESCGVIRRGEQVNRINVNHERITYQQMNVNRKKLLNLINPEDLDLWLNS